MLYYTVLHYTSDAPKLSQCLAAHLREAVRGAPAQVRAFELGAPGQQITGRAMTSASKNKHVSYE